MLRPAELSSVTQAVTGEDGTRKICVQADLSEDRLLEFASKAAATIANPKTDTLPGFDRLVIECHPEVKDYSFETYDGQVCVWKQAEAGGV
jgi:hypothetical protein